MKDNLQRLMDGLKIIRECSGDKNVDFHAEHDIIYVGDINDMNMPEEEKQKMVDLRWHIEEESWCIFC